MNRIMKKLSCFHTLFALNLLQPEDKIFHKCAKFDTGTSGRDKDISQWWAGISLKMSRRYLLCILKHVDLVTTSPSEQKKWRFLSSFCWSSMEDCNILAWFIQTNIFCKLYEIVTILFVHLVLRTCNVTTDIQNTVGSRPFSFWTFIISSLNLELVVLASSNFDFISAISAWTLDLADLMAAREVFFLSSKSVSCLYAPRLICLVMVNMGWICWVGSCERSWL